MGTPETFTFTAVIRDQKISFPLGQQYAVPTLKAPRFPHEESRGTTKRFYICGIFGKTFGS